MSELAAFLESCIAADEEAARAATPGPWSVEPYDDRQQRVVSSEMRYVHNEKTHEDIPMGPRSVAHPWHRDAAHIARHDPARVLAEVAAKRAIVNALTGAEFALDCHPDDEEERAHVLGLRKAVRALASVYEGAPGWQEEWR